jgi:hypothetical protein
MESLLKRLMALTISTGLLVSFPGIAGAAITPFGLSVATSPCITSQSFNDVNSLIELIEKDYPNNAGATKILRDKLDVAIQECELSKDKKLDVDRLKALITDATILVLELQKNNNGLAPKKFKNCAELNKVYPGGVALPGAVNKGGKTKKTPKYDKALYTANKKSDRDKDGIVCEK